MSMDINNNNKNAAKATITPPVDTAATTNTTITLPEVVAATPDSSNETRTTTAATTDAAATTAALPVGSAVGGNEICYLLSHKADDSDSTLQSEQSECVDLKAVADAVAADKTFTEQQTLDRILQAHSEQKITTGRVELGHDANPATATGEMIAKPSLSAVAKEGATQHVKSTLTVAATATTHRDTPAEGAENVLGSEMENRTSTPTGSIRSIGSLVCRICHNSENPERLVSPCLCKGSLTYVHINCLERWISTSRSTVCELCQFQYNTEQTLRYTCFQSLRMWYSRSMSRRALQEDCQMFSLLTLVAFGIIGTLLVGIQYYFLQGRTWGLSRIWTKGWLIFFLLTTLAIYVINIYMIVKSQLAPWYRWWQSARDIKLILENRKPFEFRPNRRVQNQQFAQELTSMMQEQQDNAGAAGPLTPPAPPAAPAAAPTQPPQPLQPCYPTAPPAASPTAAAVNTPIAAATPSAATHLSMTISNNVELPTDLEQFNSLYRVPRATASAVHCSVLTSAATVEIPLEGCLYEFESIAAGFRNC